MNRLLLEEIEQKQLKNDLPQFKAGDSIKVHLNIVEGEKQRIQVVEGVVIAKKGGGARETFTIRKVSYGVGVERIFPFHSPCIKKITVVRRGYVRRAKLYYLRKRRGKASRIKEAKK